MENKIKKHNLVTIGIITMVLLCTLFAITLVFLDRNNLTSYGLEMENQITVCETSFDENFCDNSIIVILDGNLSEVNKIHNISFFGNAGIVNITDLTWQTTCTNAGEYFRQILKLTLNYRCKTNVLSVARELSSLSGLEYVGLNYIQNVDDFVYEQHFDLFQPFMGTHRMPTFNDQWALHGEYGIQAVEAWSITRGSQNVRVGIADGGVAFHNTLNANVARPGWDFNRENPSNDLRGHGTQMAGLLGATGNAVGITGVAREVSIVPFRTAYNGRSMQSHTIVAAVNEARNRWSNPTTRVHIMNLSANWFGVTNGGIQILQAVRNTPNILFVWSADNNYSNLDNTTLFPRIAEFTNTPNIISVGAHTRTGARATFSNYGLNSVSIFAPGQDTWSTRSGVEVRNDRVPSRISICGNYILSGGTSGAAPHVAGVAALMLAANPNLTAIQLRALILDSAVRRYITTVSAGVQNVRFLNAYNAVRAARAFNLTPLSFRINSRTVGVVGQRTYSVSFINNNDFDVQVTYNQRMAYASGARELAGLSHLATVTVPRNGYINRNIRENIGATHITAGIRFVTGATSFLMVSYANGLTNNSSNPPSHNVINLGTNFFGAILMPGNTARITGSYCTAVGEIFIPQNLLGLQVCSIGTNAFAGQNGMTAVTIPASVTYVGAGAFADVASLERVSL